MAFEILSWVVGSQKMGQDSRAVRIVMVDDDQDDLFLTGVCFRQAPFPVEFTPLVGASKLFDYIRDNGIGAIDVLLLDLNMPITNGVDALKILQSYPHFDELNVFMFSTSSSEADRQESLAAGAKGYLRKPSGLGQMKMFVEAISKSIDPQKLSIAC